MGQTAPWCSRRCGIGFHLDSSTPTLIETVLVGIGIDYFLFMTFRFRERLRMGESGREAAANAALHVSPVVASAALAIVAAFATLGLARFGQFHVLGPSVAVAIVVMLLAGVTLVPALLAAQGRRMFWPSRSWQRSREDGPAARLGSLVARRPGRVAVLASSALLAVAVFAFGGKMNYDLTTVPKDTAAGRVQTQISQILPKGVTDEQQIYVRSSRPLTAADLKPMQRRLSHVDHVAAVSPRFARTGSRGRRRARHPGDLDRRAPPRRGGRPAPRGRARRRSIRSPALVGGTASRSSPTSRAGSTTTCG